jgi:hypothetical protein
MDTIDPLKQAEDVLKGIHTETRRQFRPLYRKYPTLFLLLITFSVAAIFHGLDVFMSQFAFFNSNPLLLVLAGIIGLFITGSLYKRLGRDRYEN